MRWTRRVFCGAALAAGVIAGAVRVVQAQKRIWINDGLMEAYNSPAAIEERFERQTQQQIAEILNRAGNQNKPLLRRDVIENGLVGLGNRATDMIATEALAHTGIERDAFQGALFRLAHASFDPPQRLAEWAQARFHFVPDPQSPFKPLPMQTARVLNIPPGSLLFPHHVFYTLTWAPTHTRLVLALATDGKIQTLEDDGALLHFLRVEGGSAQPAAVRELLASAALFLTIARADDLTEQVFPHTQSTATTATAGLTAPVTRTATLTFSTGGTLDNLTTSP